MGTVGAMAIDVHDAPDEHRYEVMVDGALAGFAEYVLRDGLIVFTHTEIGDAHEGQGVGSVLARQALDDVRSRGLVVVPQCPFIAGWIDRHDDYRELVRK